MLVYIFRRLLLGISVMFGVIVVTFSIFFLGPNDPAGAICGEQCTAERYESVVKSLGLDKPKTEQFTTYTKGLFVGTETEVRKCDAPCLGWSYIQNRPVTDMVLEALPVTTSLIAGGVIVYVSIALLFGVLAARHRATWIDRTIVTVSQLIGSVPYFVIALLFYLYVMVIWGVLPRPEYSPISDGPIQWAIGMSGVWLFWGGVASCSYIRYVRASMIDTQNQDYVRTARSKGLSERTISVKHALRAAIAPFVTLVGLNVGLEFAGSIFTETIFNINGMGNLAIDSFNTGDLPVIAGVVLVGAFFVVTLNLIVDLLYGVVDPRVKLS
ncbi:ABC transporter permease [Demetria terragena]|uniref:ABC transporter permease n=1 Tax=Demetria terragena TaxID=63959 RepID=UPI00035ED4FE|nr:ABC transporter permease [Demetria terragena]